MSLDPTSQTSSAAPTTGVGSLPREVPLSSRILRRVDYSPPPFLIPEVALDVDIRDSGVRVRSTLSIVQNPETPPGAPLVLNGENLQLRGVWLDGQPLPPAAYELTPTALTIRQPPEQGELAIEVDIDPFSNDSATGLYRSGEILCSQMEASGFRRFTYFPDRPDVLSRYTTRVTGDSLRFPHLLSNGEELARRDLPDGRRTVTWRDPFPKPCYLFALVAGAFDLLEDHFTTRSGLEVTLQIYAPCGTRERCHHAMESLKRAMRWDEETFGLECDLRAYKIVAVQQFNAGAMENKGLNIFAARGVLCDPRQTTDGDLVTITKLIGHEYLHNWTGNRITLRDWFELTLKEGLTVFRHQLFMETQRSPEVARIQDVRALRSWQFPEDAGPTAHPIRPEEVRDVENLFTQTVYEKGAEVIRMLHTLLGDAQFRRGMEIYVARHDGQAVTTENFLCAMADASGRDLTQFARWYSQVGTPTVHASAVYDAAERNYTFTFTQALRSAGGLLDASTALHIPIRVGLVGPKGELVPLRLNGSDVSLGPSSVLELRQPTQSFTFTEVPEGCVPSILRGFSAPIDLHYPYTEAELVHLVAHDHDAFNRYEASRELLLRAVRGIMQAAEVGIPSPGVSPETLAAFGFMLRDESLSSELRAEAFVLPSLDEVLAPFDRVDFGAAERAKQEVARSIAVAHHEAFLSLAEALTERLRSPQAGAPSAIEIGNRALRNVCLRYLARFESYGEGGARGRALLEEQFRTAANMTDKLGALVGLSFLAEPVRRAAFDAFFTEWQHEPLVVNKWLAMQALAPHTGVIDDVRRLMQHPVLDRRNIGQLRALVGSFTDNTPRFHDPSGAGYRFVGDAIREIDEFNPVLAATLANAFVMYPRLKVSQQHLMEPELQRLLTKPGISAGVHEVISKIVSAVKAQGNVQ